MERIPKETVKSVQKPEKSTTKSVKNNKKDTSLDGDVNGPIKETHLQVSHSLWAGIGASLLLLVGLITTFYGSKDIRITLFMFGSIVFAILSYFILNMMKDKAMIQSYMNVGLIYLLVMIFSSIIGGGLFLLLKKWASQLFGLFLGYCLSLFILELPMISSLPVVFKILIIVGLALIGLTSSYQVPDEILIPSTAFLGSLCFFCGLDYFINAGFQRLFKIFRDRKEYPIHFGCYIMIGGFFVLGIAGIIVQKKSDYLSLKTEEVIRAVRNEEDPKVKAIKEKYKHLSRQPIRK
jgi:hypothetical protein